MGKPAFVLPVVLLGACGQPPDSGLEAGLWESYRETFITDSGRVVDTGQGGISHSEGQAYAMLLAEANDDRETFERVWEWTRRHLQVRADALLAWRWDPGKSVVTDLNNASDADLVAAWALLRAAGRWDDVRFRREAWRLLNDIESQLVVPAQTGVVLLPGAHGFVHDGVVTANPSYWVFPALSHLGRLHPAGPWNALHETGRALLETARFGRWRLPADWLSLTDPAAPASAFPARFGYEAIRIPLYACWDGRTLMPGLEGVAAFWASDPVPPAWVALGSAERADFPLPPGAMAVRRLLLERVGAVGNQIEDRAGPGQDYYDATLLLLAGIADHESRG